MTKPSYRVYHPAQRSGAVVFAAPHSGRDYCRDLMSKTVLDSHAIRSSEDAFVDELFASVPACGCPLLVAQKPRAYLDLNRGPEELDPALIDGIGKRHLNPRISSGLGVIPRVVANGRAIYTGKLSLRDAEARIRDHWHPYHAKLQGLLDETRSVFGRAILLDLHSMPHEAIENTGRTRTPFPDIVLGDRFGAACDGEITDQVEEAFRAAGFRVARNTPFAGAYVTQRYGRPSRNQHALQIEIDRSLYMDEASICPNENFNAVQRGLMSVVKAIAAIGRDDQRVAAE